MRKIIEADYQQVMLLPACVEDWVGGDHPARFIREFVESLSLQDHGFEEVKSEEGGEVYAPKLLLRVWLYGYFIKIRSSRGLERGCRNEMGLIWLTGNRRPDHNTLWRFWKANKEGLRGVFRATVQVALKLELVGLVLQAVDGSKIQAVASGRKVYGLEENRRLLEALEEAIAQQEAAVEQSGDGGSEGDDGLPDGLRHKKELAQRVRAAIQEIESSGRKHCHPQEPEARRMESDGRNRFSYNGQVAVDSRQQVITAAEVSVQENDYGLLVPMIQEAQKQTGRTPVTLADGGYASSEQLARAQEQGLEVMTPLPNGWRDKEGEAFHSSQFTHDALLDVVVCPQGRSIPFAHQKQRRGRSVRVYRKASICRGCPVRSLCTSDRHGRAIDIAADHAALVAHRQKMRDPRARDLLRQRARIVEPVFAQIKANGGFRRWTVCGLQNVRVQWALLCSAWNLQRIYQHWKQLVTEGPHPFRKAFNFTALAVQCVGQLFTKRSPSLGLAPLECFMF